MRKRQTRSSYWLLPQVVGSRTDPTPSAHLSPSLSLPPTLSVALFLSLSFSLIWISLFLSFRLFLPSSVARPRISFLNDISFSPRLFLLHFSVAIPFSRSCLDALIRFSLCSLLFVSLSLSLSEAHFCWRHVTIRCVGRQVEWAVEGRRRWRREYLAFVTLTYHKVLPTFRLVYAWLRTKEALISCLS